MCQETFFGFSRSLTGNLRAICALVGFIALPLPSSAATYPQVGGLVASWIILESSRSSGQNELPSNIAILVGSIPCPIDELMALFARRIIFFGTTFMTRRKPSLTNFLF